MIIVSRILSWASLVSVLQELNSCHCPKVTDWISRWLKLEIAKPCPLEQDRNLLNESLLALFGFSNKAVCDWEAILGR